MGQNPGNPLDMYGICSKYTDNYGKAHIYLLRYQTPEEIMTRITELFEPIYRGLNVTYFNSANEVIRLGYFRLKYYSGNILVEVCDTASILRVLESMPNILTLTTDNFLHQLQNSHHFSDLVSHLLDKAFLELFIQSNFNLDSQFSSVISLDLYPYRDTSQTTMMFHEDATDAFPTKFFTLTYVITPGIVIKGPTIVTAQQIDVRSAITPAVTHGTTVGIDNTAVLHATPDQHVHIAMPGEVIDKFLQIPEGQGSMFTQRIFRNSNAYEGNELEEDSDGRERQVHMIEEATRVTPRSFIRIWYNVGENPFPKDPTPSYRTLISGPITHLIVNMNHEISNNICKIEIKDIEPPEEILSGLGNMSLGGAETGTQTKRPPEQYKHVIEKDIQKTSKQKTKPSILASPEFKKLVSSTDNFILRAVVKEKDVALPMGGKQASWSKKGKKRAMRTLKRGKRSRTTRGMGGRKLKTKAQRQRQTKRKRH